MHTAVIITIEQKLSHQQYTHYWLCIQSVSFFIEGVRNENIIIRNVRNVCSKFVVNVKLKCYRMIRCRNKNAFIIVCLCACVLGVMSFYMFHHFM